MCDKQITPQQQKIDRLEADNRRLKAQLEAARLEYTPLETAIIDADIRYHETRTENCLSAYSSYVANAIITHQQNRIEEAR